MLADTMAAIAADVELPEIRFVMPSVRGRIVCHRQGSLTVKRVLDGREIRRDRNDGY
jgi:hypothetical protein